MTNFNVRPPVLGRGHAKGRVGRRGRPFLDTVGSFTQMRGQFPPHAGVGGSLALGRSRGAPTFPTPVIFFEQLAAPANGAGLTQPQKKPDQGGPVRGEEVTCLIELPANIVARNSTLPSPPAGRNGLKKPRCFGKHRGEFRKSLAGSLSDPTNAQLSSTGQPILHPRRAGAQHDKKPPAS